MDSLTQYQVTETYLISCLFFLDHQRPCRLLTRVDEMSSANDTLGEQATALISAQP
jgi:hypothetical protein